MTPEIDTEIPDFLRRPAPTPEEQRSLARIVTRARNPKIKNPPKRASKASKLLGPPPICRK